MEEITTGSPIHYPDFGVCPYCGQHMHGYILSGGFVPEPHACSNTKQVSFPVTVDAKVKRERFPYSPHPYVTVEFDEDDFAFGFHFRPIIEEQTLCL